MSDERVRNFMKAFWALNGMAEEVDGAPEAPLMQAIIGRQAFYEEASAALGKLQLFKEDRMAVMEILDKVRRGEDATPPEPPKASDIPTLLRGAIATIYHNATKRYYEAVILGEAEKS